VKQPHWKGHERRHDLRAGHRGHRLYAGQVALQVPGGHGVPESGQDHEQAADQRLGAAAGIHTEQHPDADDSDRHPHQAARARALLAGERKRQ